MADGEREVVDRYVQALQSGDLDAQDATLHDDFEEDYPQSGERIIGKANRRAIVEHFSASAPALPKVDSVMGSQDRWVLGPSYTALRVTGTGDEFAVAGRILYPDDSEWHLIQLIRMRDGKIWRLRSYFGPTFEPASWRSQWVEPLEGPSH
jgi:ketosteroid isomerase-like protein